MPGLARTRRVAGNAVDGLTPPMHGLLIFISRSMMALSEAKRNHKQHTMAVASLVEALIESAS